MIKIELMSGEVLDNDPQFGMNLDNVQEISECLETTGEYRWTGRGARIRYEVIGTADVKRIYEE